MEFIIIIDIAILYCYEYLLAQVGCSFFSLDYSFGITTNRKMNKEHKTDMLQVKLSLFIYLSYLK